KMAQGSSSRHPPPVEAGGLQLTRRRTSASGRMTAARRDKSRHEHGIEALTMDASPREMFRREPRAHAIGSCYRNDCPCADAEVPKRAGSLARVIDTCLANKERYARSLPSRDATLA